MKGDTNVANTVALTADASGGLPQTGRTLGDGGEVKRRYGSGMTTTPCFFVFIFCVKTYVLCLTIPCTLIGV